MGHLTPRIGNTLLFFFFFLILWDLVFKKNTKKANKQKTHKNTHKHVYNKKRKVLFKYLTPENLKISQKSMIVVRFDEKNGRIGGSGVWKIPKKYEIIFNIIIFFFNDINRNIVQTRYIYILMVVSILFWNIEKNRYCIEL